MFAKRTMAFPPRQAKKAKIQKGLTTVSKKQADRNLAQEVTKLKKLVKGIAPELKYLDVALTFSNVTDTSGGIVSLNTLAQGDTVNDRTGNKVRYKSLQIDFRLDTAVASIGALPLASEASRFYVIQDNQQVADTVPALTDVFESTSLVFAIRVNKANQGRFKIVYDSGPILHTMVASQFTAVATLNAFPTNGSPHRRFFKRMDLPVTFNGTANTDIQKNGLYAAILTNVAGDSVDADGQARIRFIDD